MLKSLRARNVHEPAEHKVETLFKLVQLKRASAKLPFQQSIRFLAILAVAAPP